jgi:N,N'-diacetyllegionaminate synthase
MSTVPQIVSFGNRKVGYGQPVFITFEAGPTHAGLESAKRLISLAADAGADAIKFQILDPDRLVADRNVMFSYDVLVDRGSGATETVSEPLYDLMKRRSLSREEWRALKAHSDSLGLAFFATVGFEDEVDFLVEIGCHSIKIASADLNHVPLLRHAARTGLCLQVDTGNASIGEVEAAVDVIRAEGNNDIIIHHCPSGYPARMDGVNLRVIQTLEQMFRLPVAFSDHSPGWDMDIAAVALGANLVEKTITEDRMTRSVEHIMSLDPGEMRAFVTLMRDLETAFGSQRRIMTETERTKRLAARRSAHAAKDLAAGGTITEADIEFRRPGYGIPPDRMDELVGKRLRTARAAGEVLSISDFESGISGP